MAEAARIIRLPGGCVDEQGTIHREVELIPLTGKEEELLAQNREKQSASLVTTVISRCLKRLGTVEPVTEEAARNLLVADRQYLLLKLREITFGDGVQLTVSCPWPHCGEPVDLAFSTRDISIKESGDKGPVYSMELSEKAAYESDNGKHYRKVTFRLPSGGDQESVSPLLDENEAGALTALLERCIRGIGPMKNPSKEMIRKLSPLARMEIEKQMAAVAPCVDLDIESDCPECRRRFTVPFDLHDFFFGELRTSLDLLYREVHYLAYHYHWSEQEIMAMTRDKRHKYIEVLADEIERLNNEP
jgi:hypothetical protein